MSCRNPSTPCFWPLRCILANGGDDWREAVKRYNGGGDANYLKEVMDYFNNTTDPTPDNYVKKDKKKK